MYEQLQGTEVTWFYTRWLELKLGWLAVEKARREYELMRLKK
jgi:hypothetical protein